MSTALMASRKQRNSKGAMFAKAILEQYQPFEAMLQGEMDSRLGYESNDHGYKDTDNRRNGYTSKNVKTSYGEIPIEVPRDREATFEPQIIPKRTRDISDIEYKVIAMYARGMSQRDIADTIEDIYGFEISHEMISNITDQIIETARKKFYTFVFVDCLYVNIRKDMETKSCAVYVVLGYDVNGIKDILGLWIGDAEGKHYWLQIFDELKGRGVEDILFISTDGVSGLEEGAKSIFKDVVVQRCIVHLIRNSIKYIPSKDYKQFTAQLKKVYGSAVRKVMYTTNSIESVNSSFRKVTKKGSFPSEESVIKALYLRITELYKKWNGRPISNWAIVRNQLSMDTKIQNRMLKYENF